MRTLLLAVFPVWRVGFCVLVEELSLGEGLANTGHVCNPQSSGAWS